MVTSVQSRLGEAPEEGIKAPCVTIATGNIVLNGVGATIGGVVVEVEDRVIVAAQTDSTENGIYVVKNSDWERASDFNLIDDVANGQLVADRNTGNIFLISVPNAGWNPGVDTANFILQFAPSGITWGAITGTLSSQGDLQAELDGKAALVHTHVEADITDLQPYLLDAPSDGNDYGRRDGAWVDLNLGGLYAPLVHTHFEADILDLQDYLLDAPNDGDFYARRNLSWEMITTAAGTIGEIVMWPFEDVPENFLACDGQDYNTTTFGALFAVIGYRYGGSGPNFNVPDLRGEFIRGWANGSGRDPDRNSRTNAGDGTTGDFVGTKQADAQIPHTHGIRGGGSDDDGGPRPPGGTSNNGALEGTQSGGGHGTGNEVRPRNVYMQFIIRYSGGGSGDASVPAIEVQDNGVSLTTAVELFNFLNFNITQPVTNQLTIAFGASPNAAAFCPGHGFTFVSTADFTVPGVDVTNLVYPGRRLRFVDGATNLFGTVTGSGFFLGSTQVTMDMDGTDVLTNTITEWCVVNGAAGWTPISGDPFGGDPVIDFTSGFIGGTKYWQAISTGGKIAYSTDGGNTWTLATTGTTENLNQIAYNPDSETFLAVGNDSVLLFSSDGTSWTLDTTSINALGISGNRDVVGVGYDENQTDYWCVLYVRDNVSFGIGSAYSPDNGATWFNGDTSIGTTATMDGKLWPRYTAGGFNGFMHNIGQDVYILNQADDTTSSVLYNTSGQPDVRAAVSYYTGATTRDLFGKGPEFIEGSSIRDDVQWGTKNINGIAYIDTLQRAVFVGEDSTIGIYEFAWVEGNYNDYTRFEANGGNPLADYLCVHWDPDDGIICAGNNQGQIVRSTNGLGAPVSPAEFTGFSLIAGDPFGGAPIRRVLSGLIGATVWWVAIGNNGQLFTSTDAGATWTARTSGLSGDLLCVGYNSTDQQFVVGSRGGEFTSSSNGSTWTPDTTTIPGLGLAGTNDIFSIIWDPNSALWHWMFDVSGTTTTRAYTTPSALTPFTIADSTQAMLRDGLSRLTTTSNIIIFPQGGPSANSAYYNGPTDTSETTYGSATAGAQVLCVGTGPGTPSPLGAFTHDVMHGYDDGGIKRWGSTTGTGQARALIDTDREQWHTAPVRGIAQDGTRWITAGDNGEMRTLLVGLFDSPHNAYGIINNPFTADINDIWYDPTDGVWVAVGSNGQIATSPDGIS